MAVDLTPILPLSDLVTTLTVRNFELANIASRFYLKISHIQPGAKVQLHGFLVVRYNLINIHRTNPRFQPLR